jgi:putative transcriptional regulator
MTAHVDDLLPEYALGTLPAAERGAVDAHLRECDRCVAELAAISDALHAGALAAARLMAPQANVKARLLERVRGKGRFAPFASRIAELFDLAVEKIDEVFETFENPSNWVPGPGGGNELYFVPKGPRLAKAEAGFVRLDPGVNFPHHRHVGEETSLIMTGELHEKESNQTFRAGDVVVRAASSEHSFAIGPEGCLFAVVVFEGVEFPDLGVKYGGGSGS